MRSKNMGTKKYYGMVLAFMLVGGIFPLAADHPENQLALGPVIGAQYEAKGVGSSLGLALKFPDIPLFWATYVGFTSDSFGFSLTGDKYIYDENLIAEKGFKLDWYFGLGGYLTIGSQRDVFIMATGARFPLGASWHINKEWELFLALTPTVGISLAPELKFPDWFIGAELGLRYWFPRTASTKGGGKK
ncbi:MAG TPA: hypothetical protein PLW34_05665 [Termitinemataceae bacterium]|nr:hypothetical protein [Termitinemataceae bacterium]HOM22909.1 hypothetical protein [Termitinemataceae bacterium]HPQ00250.1 hypothetical protein [Termitinemataceae bacterium]